jgi:hypothetical protein
MCLKARQALRAPITHTLVSYDQEPGANGDLASLTQLLSGQCPLSGEQLLAPHLEEPPGHCLSHHHVTFFLAT